MIEFVVTAIGAASLGAAAAVATVRRRMSKRRDDLAQLIAMGEGMGIEYVPGEDIEGIRGYRQRVIDRRDDLARKAAAKRDRDERGRFV